MMNTMAARRPEARRAFSSAYGTISSQYPSGSWIK